MIDLGDLSAEPGSEKWAIAVRHKAQAALKDCESDSQSLRSWIKLIRDHKGYLQLKTKMQTGFRSFEQFCKHGQPEGLGYAPEAIDGIIAERGRREARQMALKDETIGPHGVKIGDITGNNITSPPIQRGDDSDYLTRRIKRDNPEIHEQMKAGAFTSVRQAALKAGIVQPSFQCPKDLEKAAKRLLIHFQGERLAQLIILLSR